MLTHPPSPSSLQLKIAALDTDSLARAAGFLRRRSHKLTPANFLLTTCLFALQHRCSLASFAQHWAALHNQYLSKQAVHKRFGQAAVQFLQAVLQKVLASSLLEQGRSLMASCHGFNRILLQDSTCLSLPARLASLFPGPANQKSKKQAGLKIQATLDLLKNQWLQFQVTPFTVNDQKASPDILERLQPADLVIRDLGYLVLDVLKQIHQRGAYFLSRLRCDLALFCPHSQARLSLLACLKGTGSIWEREVLLGEQKLRVRLIAVRLPEATVAERRRKARQNRDQRLHRTEEYFQLLAWNIFITNVPAALLEAPALAWLYSLRWRIEIIFKTWKSHFKIDQLTDVSASQLLIVIFAKLIWICWFSVQWTALATMQEGSQVSLLKLAQWWATFAFVFCVQARNVPPDGLILQPLYYCSYEKRKKRLNFLQKCAFLG
jgi:hypothetical protein